MSLIRTEDARYVRDTTSMALLNTDQAALQQHRAARQKAQQQDVLVEDVRELKQQLQHLTELVHQLLTTRS